MQQHAPALRTAAEPSPFPVPDKKKVAQKYGWGVQWKPFGRKGSYHVAFVERPELNRHVSTWRYEGGCHMRPTAAARFSNSNCGTKHHISSVFVPRLWQLATEHQPTPL